MDVLDLAPALLAVGEMFSAADAAMNGHNTSVSTKVQAEFREGSFEIVFAIEQHLVDAAVGLLPSLHLIGADKLIGVVIGSVRDKIQDKAADIASGTVVGLFKLLSRLAGETPREITSDGSKNAFIFNFGDNNSITVDQQTTELYQSKKTLSAATKVALPLMRKGVDKLKVRQNSEDIAVLRRVDFPQIEGTQQQESSLNASKPESEPHELTVRIVTFDFDKDKLMVSDGGKPFEVKLDDEEFRARVHARKVGFFDRDYYRVSMTIDQKIDGRGLRTVRSISNVTGPILEGEQTELPLLENGAARSDSQKRSIRKR